MTGELRIERFEPSKRYNGYRDLGEVEIIREATFQDFSPFVAIAGEMAEMVHGVLGKSACGIGEALSGMEIIDRLGSTGLSNDPLAS